MNEILSPGSDPTATIPSFQRVFPADAPLHQFHGEPVRILKTHLAPGGPRFDGVDANCVGVITIHRHPLDVLLSAANYSAVKSRNFFFADRPAKSVEDILKDGEMAQYIDAFIANDGVPEFASSGPLSAYQATWDRWAANRRHLRLQYESLVENPAAGVQSIIEFLGAAADGQRSGAIVETAESKTKLSGRFFWRKKAYNYRELLSPELIDRFTRGYGAHAEALGYDLA